MCGAQHGPEHDDPLAARVCDLSHQFGDDDFDRIQGALDERQKELLWTVALGIGPDGLARRFGSTPDRVRVELSGLADRLVDLETG